MRKPGFCPKRLDFWPEIAYTIDEQVELSKMVCRSGDFKPVSIGRNGDLKPVSIGRDGDLKPVPSAENNC